MYNCTQAMEAQLLFNNGKNSKTANLTIKVILYAFYKPQFINVKLCL